MSENEQLEKDIEALNDKKNRSGSFNMSMMLHAFWSMSSGVPAFDEGTVPKEADVTHVFPRITYSVSNTVFGDSATVTASIWDYSSSWARVEQVKSRIASLLGIGGYCMRTDSGAMWITPGTPYMQRVKDNNDMVRRILINVEVQPFQ